MCVCVCVCVHVFMCVCVCLSVHMSWIFQLVLVFFHVNKISFGTLLEIVFFSKHCVSSFAFPAVYASIIVLLLHLLHLVHQIVFLPPFSVNRISCLVAIFKVWFWCWKKVFSISLSVLFLTKFAMFGAIKENMLKIMLKDPSRKCCMKFSKGRKISTPVSNTQT